MARAALLHIGEAIEAPCALWPSCGRMESASFLEGFVRTLDPKL